MPPRHLLKKLQTQDVAVKRPRRIQIIDVNGGFEQGARGWGNGQGGG
jgi:hypothetical protein